MGFQRCGSAKQRLLQFTRKWTQRLGIVALFRLAWRTLPQYALWLSQPAYKVARFRPERSLPSTGMPTHSRLYTDGMFRCVSPECSRWASNSASQAPVPTWVSAGLIAKPECEAQEARPKCLPVWCWPGQLQCLLTLPPAQTAQTAHSATQRATFVVLPDIRACPGLAT